MYLMQFRIELLGVSPPIWRRIQVPEDYSLWDLHVAIQDAMGWLDSHLHLFRVVGSELAYGIPDEDGDDVLDTRPGWEALVQNVFTHADPVGIYEYDFGDSWLHLLVLEDIVDGGRTAKRPRCIAGERACPPEDCGGPPGYAELLEALRDPSHEEHEEVRDWVGEGFDPEEFDAAAVAFDDPGERWRRAFADDEG